MSQDISSPPGTLTFEAAREHVLASLHEACGLLNDARFSKRSADPKFDIAFAELAMDSLAMVEATMALEDRIGVELDVGDLVSHATLNALSRLLVARAGGR
jgi:acyl carrier protein